MAFKALAICATDELRAAHLEILAADKADRRAAEAKADEFIATPVLAEENAPPAWDDLPPERLGQVAITDEVRPEWRAASVRVEMSR